MPPVVEEVGSMDWWHNGWAVGDNARDRLCLRRGLRPLRKFFDFDEAVRYAFARQRKYKTQQHVLVYVTKNALGIEKKHVVRSLDDIAEVNTKNDQEVKERVDVDARRRARLPEFDLLMESFSYMKAWQMAETLAKMRENGCKVVVASMKKSTWYRFKKDLEKIGIALPL